MDEEQTNFPYAAQFIKVLRSRSDLTGKTLSQETAYFVTSLSPKKMDARQLAESIRGHWSIENSLHWVRDYPRSSVIREEAMHNAGRNGCVALLLG